jgi:ferritin
VSAIPAPPKNPISINNCFEKVFEHEVDNTNAVYKLVKMSHDQEDWATWNFMQWFVKEQVEEETLAMNLLDKMKIAGGENMNSNALYLFDKEMEETPDEVILAQEVTAENP